MPFYQRLSKISYITALLLLAGVSSWAQRYTFHNLGIDDGLIQSQATCFAQDPDGKLWIGTMGGVSSFDGQHFDNISTGNGLLSNLTNGIAADKNGNIWISNSFGLQKLTGKTLQNFLLPFLNESDDEKNKKRRDPRAQVIQVGDSVWWRVRGELYLLKGNKLTKFNTPAKDNPITSILADKQTLWVAQRDTIFRLQNNKWDTITFSDKPTGAPGIRCMYTDKNAVTYIGTDAGLYSIDGKKIKAVKLNNQDLNFFTINRMIVDRSGALWMATQSGIMKMEPNKFTIFNKKNGLADNSFTDIFEDREGNIWMASDGLGIYRFSGTLFTCLDESSGLASSQVMALAHNKRDSLFLGTVDAGLFVYKDEKAVPLPLPGATRAYITSLCYSRSQKLWIGTYNYGLYEYSKNKFRVFQPPHKGFNSNSIFALYEDAKSRLWIGFRDGVTVLENDSFKTIPIKPTRIQGFSSIGADSILIVTESKGIMLCTNGVTSEFVTHSVLDSYSISCIYTSGKYIWAGTGEKGVFRYDLESHKAVVFNKANGLKSDFIYNIIGDKNGNIWLGTGFGIQKIMNPTADNPQLVHFGKSDGVKGMESNSNASIMLPDGTIWFGTTNGAMKYNPSSLQIVPSPTRLLLQSVKVAGESTIDRSWFDSLDALLGVPLHLVIPYKKSSISFSFRAISLVSTENLLYRYTLEGLDPNWSEWSQTNTVNYSTLPSGKFRLHVQCKIQGLEEAYPELIYEFEVETPFIKTIWFKLLIIAGLVALGVLLQNVLTRQKRRRQKLVDRLRREEQDKIRIRTAEDFHDEVGNRITRINLLTKLLKNKIIPTPEIDKLLVQIEENTGSLYEGTRDILWSLKPANDNLFEILCRVQEFGHELFEDSQTTFVFHGIVEKYRKIKLPMDMSRNFIMIYKEALNNVLKYANAGEVSIEVTMPKKTVVQLILRDNGKGFDTTSIKRGNGINNMMQRAERLHGRLYIDSRPDKGTILTLTFKVQLQK